MKTILKNLAIFMGLVSFGILIGFKVGMYANSTIPISPTFIYKWEFDNYGKPELIAYPESKFDVVKR